MNLCGDRKIASLPAMSMSTYGPAAAKSQQASAPCSWSSAEIAAVSVMIPVTLDAAENEPILSVRLA